MHLSPNHKSEVYIRQMLCEFEWAISQSLSDEANLQMEQSQHSKAFNDTDFWLIILFVVNLKPERRLWFYFNNNLFLTEINVIGKSLMKTIYDKS